MRIFIMTLRATAKMQNLVLTLELNPRCSVRDLDTETSFQRRW